MHPLHSFLAIGVSNTLVPGSSEYNIVMITGAWLTVVAYGRYQVNTLEILRGAPEHLASWTSVLR